MGNLRHTLSFTCSLVAETRLDIGHATQKVKTETFGSSLGEVRDFKMTYT